MDNQYKISYIKQPVKSNTCGQHCVAMITGQDVSAVTRAMGRNGLTNTSHLVRALHVLGYSASQKLQRIKGSIPNLCVLKICWNGTKRSHWVVHINGVIYDPAHGIYNYKKSDVESVLNGRFTSFLEIKKLT